MPFLSFKELKIYILILSKNFSFKLSALSLLAVVYELGFVEKSIGLHEQLKWLYFVTLLTSIIFIFIRFFSDRKFSNIKAFLLDLLFVMLSVITIYFEFKTGGKAYFVNTKEWVYILVFYMFIRESLALKMDLKKILLNPAQLFVLSFVV